MILADCDELLTSGLDYYDDGSRGNVSTAAYFALDTIDVERRTCAPVLFSEYPPSGLWTEYEYLILMHHRE